MLLYISIYISFSNILYFELSWIFFFIFYMGGWWLAFESRKFENLWFIGIIYI